MAKGSNNGGGAQRKLTVDAIRTALELSGGILTVAARQLGVHRSTVYEYLNEFPELKVERSNQAEQLKDLAEAQVVKAIKDGDMRTVQWYLDRMAKDRGYGHVNVDLGNQGGKPLEVTGTPSIDLSKLSHAEKKAILGAVKRDDPQ